jgi:DNA-binding IscR family transcriptional regulator
MLTKRVDYGLMAMQYVAVHQGVGPIAVTQIAEQFNIPSELKRGGPRTSRTTSSCAWA